MEEEDRLVDKLDEVLDDRGLRAPVVEAATVAGPRKDAEASLIGQQQWQAIHERRGTGLSVSRIACEFDLDRKTVRSCLAQRAWQPYRREVVGSTMLDAHRTWLVERASQVRYSARILWQELRGQHGFAGCYETVKRAVRPLLGHLHAFAPPWLLPRRRPRYDPRRPAGVMHERSIVVTDRVDDLIALNKGCPRSVRADRFDRGARRVDHARGPRAAAVGTAPAVGYAGGAGAVGVEPRGDGAASRDQLRCGAGVTPHRFAGRFRLLRSRLHMTCAHPCARAMCVRSPPQPTGHQRPRPDFFVD